MASSTTTIDFPTADNVPFPYESPYNVQRELMAAILGALHQCNDTKHNNGAGDDEEGGDDICNIQSTKKRRRRAPIIMLESPTGTGKSLSLACASMAWLKYCESADIDELLDVGATDASVDKVKAVSPSPTSTSSNNNIINSKPKPKKYDWIEAWQPPDDQQQLNESNNISSSHTHHASTSTSQSSSHTHTTTQQQQSSKGEQIRDFAIQNRSALNTELKGIRARLDRLVNIANFANNNSDYETTTTTTTTTTTSNSCSTTNNKERTIRENLVKSGVSSAMAKERKMNRKRVSGVGGSTIKRRKTGAASHSNSSSSSSRREEDEFLLDAYHSDDEGYRGSNKRGNVSSDSEDDDDDIALNDLANNKKKKQHQQGADKSKRSLSQSVPKLSSKALLEGSNLDGSGYLNDPERNARNHNHTSINTKSSNSSSNPAVGGVTPSTGLRKIIYAARTHSQLSQFISELRRTHWGKDVKVVALGSRSLLCSNEDVLYSSKSNKKSSRRSEAQITEMCLDMQKSKKKSSGGANNKRTNEGDDAKTKKVKPSCCPYKASSEAISTLALHSLVKPSDIEDMANLGKAARACSYYASREALAAAEVVVLPYNTLLSPQARQSVGLSISNALIVIDEAHNIPEALRSISSCQFSLPVAEAALSQLLAYTRKYSERLAGRNIFYLGQIRRIISAMIKYLKRPQPASKSDDKEDTSSQRKQMMAAVDLMFTLKLDNINLFSILRYLEKSRLSQKLLGFINHTTAMADGPNGNSNTTEEQPKEKTEFMSKHVSSMSIFETFIQRLTGTSREGKVIVEWPSEEDSSGRTQSPTFRFVQIHSASQLDNVVEEAHAIILAGGTLRPFTHVAAELFNDVEVMSAASTAEGQLARNYDQVPSASSKSDSAMPSSLVQVTPRLTTFTCGHVIPPSNVVTACLSFGPSSQKLDFRHSSRSSHAMIDELGRSILNLCSVVPNGFVVFFPSYSYESQVFQRWRATGLLSLMEKKKSVHREPKNSRDLEAALAKYSNEASSTKAGAILFSVMGGKMSEGINFADDLCRCVLVAGLPYPDITDPVLKEKMQSLDKECRNAGIGITGQAYYQNLCMRTVNQSVGRAIRHANDYAAIVLADFRYSSDTRIWRELPQWLRRGRGVPSQSDAAFGKVMKDVRSFFAEK